MLYKLRQAAARHLINIPGWRTNRKIVVIQSDDWGSIRMPSKEAFDKLLLKNINVDRSVYDKYDVLEQREDLECLFNSLLNHQDQRGNYPVFTFNTVMGNPAFDLIKDDKFERYHHEDIESSYLKYNGDNIFDLWCYAIDEKLIHPQFHAREHLNVSLWMEALKRNQHKTRISFNHNFFGLKTNTPSPYQKNYLAAYWPTDRRDFKRKIDVLQEGFEMFESKFGFPSDSFVACNYIFPIEMEKFLSESGIKYIQTQRGHISPDITSGDRKIRRHFTGKSNAFNQLYLVRNCTFEPTLESDNTDVIENCLEEIATAFRWSKPAIISTHRINYVGGLSAKNRDRNLNKLEELLTKVLNIWPQIEFMSTTELGKVMRES